MTKKRIEELQIRTITHNQQKKRKGARKMLTWGGEGRFDSCMVGTREALRRLLEIFGADARVLDVMMALKVLGVGMNGVRGRVH